MKKVSAYTSWQPLEEVIVGRVYTPDYFDHIKDTKTREQLQSVLAETNEDLDNLQHTIEQYGSIVQRPELPEKSIFLNEQINGRGVPLPPLTPRDWQITLGEKLLRILPLKELNDICREYQDQVVNAHGTRWNSIYQDHSPLAGASASCIVRVGTDIFMDNSEWLTADQCDWITKEILGPEYRVHEAITEGHGDAVFAILKPGVILTSMHDEYIDYGKDFPNWDLYRVRDASIDAAMKVGDFKHENFNGAWYVQTENPSPEFATYVDTYLSDWVGYISETVFDVNCLVLDEENVIFSAENLEVFKFCDKHKINPIVSPLRHQYFWDGGISCCTQDIRRKGGLETYL